MSVDYDRVKTCYVTDHVLVVKHLFRCYYGTTSLEPHSSVMGVKTSVMQGVKVKESYLLLYLIALRTVWLSVVVNIFKYGMCHRRCLLKYNSTYLSFIQK